MSHNNADESIDPSSEGPTDDWQEDSQDPSRSQLRREALAIRSLAIEIGELSPAARGKLPLPEALVAGLEELDRIKHKNARKRHLGFLTKMMRNMDVQPIEAALEKQRQAARANSSVHHSIERWRDRLMGVDEHPEPKAALTEFVDQFPHSDRQQLAQLQRKVLQELARQQASPQNEPQENSGAVRHPPSARQLFRFVRDAVTHTE